MTNWATLTAELQEWDQQGLSLPLWWRDDDAISDTAALRQLTSMAANAGVPVYTAVIPSAADRTLQAFVSNAHTIIPTVHGWAHQNHAPPDQKKAEFGAHRPLEDLQDDVERGFGRLHSLFGSRLQPMFVPPWNRITPDLLERLPDLGLRIVSTYTPRATQWAAPGLEQVNTHIDPIDWRGSRSLIDEAVLLDHVTRLLVDRRTGTTDNTEPLGLLTHHLVHDPAIWSFCDRLTDTLLSGPATPWRLAKGDST